MSTRAVVHFKGSEHDPDKIKATVFVHSDGYPTGLGAKLKAVFAGATMRNGLRSDGVEVNGPGCAAATFIRRWKAGPGGIYVYPTGASDVGEDYTYTISGEINGPITVKVESRRGTLYDGPILQLDCEKVELADIGDD